MSDDDKDWKSKLTKEQYAVLRNKDTEPPFTGELLNNKSAGMYVCAGCGQKLFSSDTKYDSGSGWPSFYGAIGDEVVTLKQDDSLGMVRTEVVCTKCGGHLGHLFEDGPEPSGMRYCINSVSLDFKGEDSEQ